MYNEAVTAFLSNLRNSSLENVGPTESTFAGHVVTIKAGAIARWSVDGQKVKNVGEAYRILCKGVAA